MAQAAAVAAIGDQEYISSTRKLLIAGQKQMTDGLRALGLDPVETVTNFIMFRFEKAAALTAAMTKRKVIVRPLAGFGLPDYVRISIGTEEENAKCLAALAEALKEI